MFKLIEKAKRSVPGVGLTISTPFEFYESDPHNMLHVLFWKTSLWFRVPYLLKTKSEWVDCPQWARPNPGYEKKGYFKHTKREYGFTTVKDSGVHVYYGIQPGEWHSEHPEKSDHVKIFDYFWNYKHVRWDAYSADGSYLCNGQHLREWIYKYDAKYRDKNDPSYIADKDERFQTVPQFVFPKSEKYDAPKGLGFGYNNFADVSSDIKVFEIFQYTDHFDGAKILMKVNIEEREWIRGIWGWLRAILKHIPGCRMISRVMNIEFNDEVGSEKGSWKGGIVGMSFDMLPNETLQEAAVRFQQEWRDRRCK